MKIKLIIPMIVFLLVVTLANAGSFEITNNDAIDYITIPFAVGEDNLSECGDKTTVKITQGTHTFPTFYEPSEQSVYFLPNLTNGDTITYTFDCTQTTGINRTYINTSTLAADCDGGGSDPVCNITLPSAVDKHYFGGYVQGITANTDAAPIVLCNSTTPGIFCRKGVFDAGIRWWSLPSLCPYYSSALQIGDCIIDGATKGGSFFVRVYTDDVANNQDLFGRFWINNTNYFSASKTFTGQSITQIQIYEGHETSNVTNLQVWDVPFQLYNITDVEFASLEFQLSLVYPPNNTFNLLGLDNRSYTGFINLSCNQNCSFVSVNDTRWEFNSSNATSFSVFNDNFTNLENGEYVINITANDTNGNVADTLAIFRIDVLSPGAVSNIDNNTFTNLNFSAQINYTDNRDLLKANVSLDNNLFIDLDGLSGMFFSLNFTVTPENLSTLGIGNERINITTTVCDSHTGNYIKDFVIYRDKYKIKFDDLEIISKNKTKEITYKKLTDRYTFTLEYDEPKEWIEIEVDKDCTYIEHTPYRGHFVCGNKWIDFEGDHEVFVYEHSVFIVPKKPKKKFTFNSVGELNCNTFFLGFYDTFNTTVIFTDPVFEGSPQDIILQIDCEPNPVTSSATLNYNSTLIETTRTEIPGQVNYTASFDTPIVNTESNVSLFFNFTINDDTQRNSSIENQTINTWAIDDCSTFTDNLFTFEIRDERNSSPIITSVNFNFLYRLENSTANKTFQIIRTGNSTYEFCKNVNATFDAVVMSNIMSRTDYGTRTYNLFNSPLVGIITAYLLEDDANSDTVTFTFIDTGNTPVENARVSIFRNINGTPTLMQSSDSDFAGQIVAFLDQLFIYQFTVNATGFPFKTFVLQPINTAYTITLTRTEDTFFTSPYDGIRYRIKHNGVIGFPDIMNVSDEPQNITLELEGSNLVEVGLNLSNHNFECVPSNCFNSITSANGGEVTVSIKANETGRISTAFFFQIEERERTYLNDGLIKVVPFIFAGTNSFLDLMIDVRDNTSPNTRTVLVALASIAGIGIGASIGLFGFLLIIPVLIVNILFSLPDVAFIHPLVGMIVSVFGVGMYLFSQMQGGST